jgi:chromosomal replication initiation ATPase DnaA
LAEYCATNAGNVTGPETTTELSVPQWGSATRTLTAGLTVQTTLRAAASATDSAIATEAAVRAAVDHMEHDLTSLTDIGSALSDVDLFLVDDGAVNVPRKCAASRIKTYCQTGVVMNADYNANTILAATADNTPTALTVDEQTLVGRITGGNIAALSAATVRTLLGLIQQTTVADPMETADDLVAGAGSAQGDHTLDDVTDTFSQTTLNNNFATIVAEYNKLKDDVEAIKSALTDTLSRLETLGLFASE